MVTKVLSGGLGGDLNNYFDSYGHQDDTITISDTFNYRILTYDNPPFELDGGETLVRYDIIDISTAPVSLTRRVDIFSGADEDIVTGSSGLEYVFDGSGDDVVDLRGGNDVAYVSSGNDSYNGGDGIDWLSFQYTDTDGYKPLEFNSVGVRVDLQITTAQNFGIFGFDTVTNFENIDGGNGADTFLGDANSNRFLGAGGADRLFGRGGADRLFGEAGADTMQGNAGGDFIYCGTGTGGQDGAQDKVQYTRATDSGVTALTRDTIYYFDRGGTATDDRIDLSLLDGGTDAGRQGFTWLGTAANFTAGALGQVRIQDLGNHVVVHIDTDGDADGEMSIFVYNVVSLARSDFIGDFIL